MNSSLWTLIDHYCLIAIRWSQRRVHGGLRKHSRDKEDEYYHRDIQKYMARRTVTYLSYVFMWLCVRLCCRPMWVCDWYRSKEILSRPEGSDERNKCKVVWYVVVHVRRCVQINVCDIFLVVWPYKQRQFFPEHLCWYKMLSRRKLPKMWYCWAILFVECKWD